MSKRKRKNGKWVPPKGATKYFYASSDDDFKQAHPVGYFFLVLLGITAFLLPMIVYIFITPDAVEGKANLWALLGVVGSMIIGIGLFNFVAIIINQYLGHLVSILSFVIGGILVWLSIVLMK